jgi:hypothetical protein
MSSLPYETFKGVTDWRKDGFSDNLLYGIVEWLKWAFLSIGGFENVLVGNPDGLYGGHPARLRPVTDDPNFDDGCVWEGIKTDWVWESTIPYTTQPVDIDGVYVNGTPYAPDSVTHPHYVDYPHGRIVFDNAVPTSSVVLCSHSYRTPTISFAKEPWLQELMYESFDVSRDDFLTGTGGFSKMAETRRQMPTIAVELGRRHGYKPYQLGGGQWLYQDVTLYTLCENDDERTKIMDILSNQSDKVIIIPDRALMKENDVIQPSLDIYGRKVDEPVQYPDLIKSVDDGGFEWTRVMLKHAHGNVMQSTNHWLYRGTLRWSVEAILEKI